MNDPDDAKKESTPNPSLRNYASSGFSRGRPLVVEAVWWITQWLLIRSWIPGSAHRRFLLRLFGAQVGKGVIIKPGVRVKFPWRLCVGDHSWLGEDVWIDNLESVWIGSNCCLSQGAYLCTGSHEWTTPDFQLRVSPIVIEDGAWLAAKSRVGPGVKVGRGAVLTFGSIATSSLESAGIYCGNPAAWKKPRRVRTSKD